MKGQELVCKTMKTKDQKKKLKERLNKELPFPNSF